jgi:hypothetical protein
MIIYLPFSSQTRTIQINPLRNSDATIAVDDMYGSVVFVRE